MSLTTNTGYVAHAGRLRNGKTIHTVTALLLQLVQTTAHELRTSVRRLHKDRDVKSVTSSQKTDVVDDSELVTENELQVSFDSLYFGWPVGLIMHSGNEAVQVRLGPGERLRAIHPHVPRQQVNNICGL